MRTVRKRLWLRLLLVADQTRQDSVEGKAGSNEANAGSIEVAIGGAGKDTCIKDN